MPEATYTHGVVTTATVEQAWTALQDPGTWSNIGPVASVSDPEYADDGTLVGFNWVANIGGKAYPGVAQTTAYTKPDRFELTMDTSEMAGDVIATLAQANSGCEVDHVPHKRNAVCDVLSRNQANTRYRIPAADRGSGRGDLGRLAVVRDVTTPNLQDIRLVDIRARRHHSTPCRRGSAEKSDCEKIVIRKRLLGERERDEQGQSGSQGKPLSAGWGP